MTDSKLYDNLRSLISVVDHLRDVGLQKYINLPRIVVVGTQSSGKSSVLESIVGLDFLPRGEGVCTRRPLELRLVHLSETENDPETAWAVFGNKKNETFTDFIKVKEEIERQTNEVAGDNKGIVDDPIVLTIYAVACPDLTLIDLPGITRVPLRGSDQNDDIETMTRNITLRYIQDPRTIVLAVLPANNDVSTSDALQLAKKVDPHGYRTIGVITKIDIMDRGTDAVKMLRGEVHLRLGYVGVINRSQADITSQKSIKSALADEEKWFASHVTYSKLPPGLTGTKCLIDKLTKVLFKHIRNFLPQIKKELVDKKQLVSDRLEELGEGVPPNISDQVQLMWTMITDYSEMFRNTIRGKYDRRLQHYLHANSIHNTNAINELASGGAQIRALFNNFLSDDSSGISLNSVTSQMSDEDISNAIRMHEGDFLPGFPSADTFEYLILPYLRKLSNPSIECLNSTSLILESLSQRIGRIVFQRFPKLLDSVLSLTADIFAREKEQTKLVVENLIRAETSYLFTNDLSYLTRHGSMEPIYKNNQAPSVKSPTPTSSENTTGITFEDKPANTGRNTNFQPVSNSSYSTTYVSEIRGRLDTYFQIILKSVRDSIPRVVGSFLVREVQDKLQFELYNSLNKEKLITDLLGEPPHIREERAQLKAQIETLSDSYAVLQKDPAINALQIDALEDDNVVTTTNGTATSNGKPSTNQSQTQPTHQTTNFPKPPAQVATGNPVNSLFKTKPKANLPKNPLFDEE